MTLLDENAFGLLVCFHDIEDAEYANERHEFVARYTRFREVVIEHAEETPLAPQVSTLDLGHALYFELADGDQAADLISWLRALRATLVEEGFAVSAVLSHGGRWLDDAEPAPERDFAIGAGRGLRASLPSEAFRRALYAEAATHGRDGEDGWGAGLYVDSEAIEALGKSLKNAPTALEVAGATFYRIGR